ncbi:MAG TPA: hypothetical protein PKM25_17140 [Candidatus Ozemobacteraceae bacterium]|nr:hypothetical protein [Candidatus Ozemobacteraceae bacterium]
MSIRYNPHRIAREACSWPQTQPLRQESLDQAVRHRAARWWSGSDDWTPLTGGTLSVAPETAAEYGYDAVCIASLTAGNGVPDTALLESAFRWLSLVHDHSTDARRSLSGSDENPLWDASPWLAAAFTARDHLVLRGHAYPALAAMRKAWKQSPPDSAAPASGMRLIWSLLLPFAPLLARFLLGQTGDWPPASLETLAEPFMPRQAVRIALEQGGWNWVVVDAGRFQTEPVRELADIRWIANALGNRSWTVRNEGEGWRVCLSQPPVTAVNS